MNERTLFDAYKARPTRDGLLAVLGSSQHTVYNLCYQVLRHAQDAEDASQKVFLRILDTLPRISDGEHYRRMLSRVSYQVALNTLESRKTRRAHEMKSAEGADPAAPTSPDGDSTLLHQHIAGLDENLRCLLVDHYFEGKAMEAMAAERGCSRVAVWKGIEKARECLRLSLSSAGLAAVALVMQSTLEAAVFTEAPRNLIGKAVLSKVAAMVLSAAPGTGGGALGPLQGAQSGGWMAGIPAGTRGGAALALAGLAGTALLVVALFVAFRGSSGPVAVPGGSRRESSPALARVDSPRPPGRPSALATPRPAAPERPRPRSAPRPYPFGLPRPDWNPAVQAAWNALNTRHSLDCQDTPVDQILETISKQTGLVIRVDPALQLKEEFVTFLVSDIISDGALRLLLSPRNKGYSLQEDGTLFISTPDKAVSAYSEEIRQVTEALQNLLEAQSRPEQTDGRSESERTKALLDARLVSPPQGEWSLGETLEALSKSADLPISLDTAGGLYPLVTKLLAQRCLNVVDERPLSDQLTSLLSARGLDFAVTDQGVLTVSTPEGAQALRQEEARRAELRRGWALQLDRSVGISGGCTLADLPEAVERALGLPLVTSREVWESAATATLPEGATVRESLDGFRAMGLRWAIQEGRLYLWSKP